MKILFTDLDGTLLNKDSIISDYAKAYLTKFTKAGNILVLASGRPLDSILQVKEHAGIDFEGMYIIANNGALVYDCDKKCNILETRLEYAEIEKIWNIAKSQQLHIQTYTDNEIISIENDAEIEFYTRRIHLPVIVSNNPLTILKKPSFKLLAIALDGRERLYKFQKEILSKLDTIDSVFSSDAYLEVFSKKAGKGNALKWLCEQKNIPISDSLAAGDSMNDLSMLEVAGTAIVMKNAESELFPHATVVTEFTNADDGLIRYLETII